MFKYKFFVDPRHKESAVKLRITNNRKKAEISLGFTLSESELKNVLSAKPSATNAKWSRIISRYIAKLEHVRAELIETGDDDMEVLELKERIAFELALKAPEEEEVEEQEQNNLFLPYFMSVGETKAKSTFESFKYTQSLIRKIQPSADTLTFEDITYTWLSDMEAWMKRKSLSQNTRKIHFGNIRIAMREAYKRGLTDNDPFRRFSFRPGKTRKRSLKIEELRKLFEYPVEEYAVFYLDMFKLIFMLCGINTIDLFNLTKINRYGRIEYDRSKNGRAYSIRIEPEAMDIINKYRGDKKLLCMADRWSDHRNFRHQLNTALQSIGVSRGKGRKRLSGQPEWPELTSYWARHTWGSIARSIGVSKDDIALALGHGGRNPVTDIYIDEDMELIDKANRRVLDWVLYGKR